MQPTFQFLHHALVAEHVLHQAVVLVLPELGPVSGHHASTVLASAESVREA